MGKRKRNSVNPHKKDKEKSGKKTNPIYRVAGANLKARHGSKKEVNLRNQALVEDLDRQLGEQQQQALKKPEAKDKERAKKSDKTANLAPDDKTVDEHVADLSAALMQS